MEPQLIQFDFSRFPTTFDILHLILAMLVLLLTVLLITILTIIVIGALRKGRKPGAPAATHGEATPEAPAPQHRVRPEALEQPEPKPAVELQPRPAPALTRPAEAVPAPLRTTGPESALQLLSLLQKDARLLDFVAEDITAFDDADVGVAARLVHEGCRKVLRGHFQLEPVRTETEGMRITLAPGFDAQAVRLTGNVVGQPPFQGTLVHKGWRAASVDLPQLASGHDPRILAPAEVEL